MDQNGPFWPKYAHFWTKIGPKIDKKWILKIRTIKPAEVTSFLSENAIISKNGSFMPLLGPDLGRKFTFFQKLPFLGENGQKMA